MSIIDQVHVFDHIPISSLLVRHCLSSLLLELGITVFKFKIVLLTFFLGAHDLFSQLSAITLNYLKGHLY